MEGFLLTKYATASSDTKTSLVYAVGFSTGWVRDCVWIRALYYIRVIYVEMEKDGVY